MAIANTQLSETTSESENVFKDPYLLDFLQLRADYLEKDLQHSTTSRTTPELCALLCSRLGLLVCMARFGGIF